MAKTITAYKGFDKDWKCRGLQYEVGKTYEHEGKVSLCDSGFHACESPFDVWLYYGPHESKFATVKMDGVVKDKDQKDSKIASGKITIEAELTLPEIIKSGVDWLLKNTKDNKKDSARIGSGGDYAQIGSGGDYARIGSGGDYAQIGSGGDYAQIGSGGDYAQIGSSGDYARIGSSGYYARIGSGGDSAQIGSSGYYARIGSSGDSAQIGSSGDSARIGSGGDSARIECSGQDSVVASAGPASRFKGKKGNHVALAEFKDGKCVGFATGCVGKGGIKEDTWYEAKGGKLVKVK